MSTYTTHKLDPQWTVYRKFSCGHTQYACCLSHLDTTCSECRPRTISAKCEFIYAEDMQCVRRSTTTISALGWSYDYCKGHAAQEMTRHNEFVVTKIVNDTPVSEEEKLAEIEQMKRELRTMRERRQMRRDGR